MSEGLAITVDDVRDAARVIHGQVLRTPCAPSLVLSKLTGAEVWLKFENFQFTASFKERGAINKLSRLTQAERDAGVAAMSAGNHAQAVAHHATRLGIRSTIVMPTNTPFTKVRNTRDLGGEVIMHGDTLGDAFDYMQRELVEGRGMTLVHPYDDRYVMAGQGTIALEMLEDVPELDTLVIPIGGGGLFSGNAVAAHALNPKLRVVGNLPYNISTPILFHLLGAVDHVVDQHFMLQKEVVDRMAASPGCKDYGRLTVMLQWRYAVEAVFDVPPEAFDPPPRVMSAIVRMQPYAKPPAVDTALMGEMVAAAFSQRRKLLRHSLGVWLTARGFSGHFDLQRRAEEVPVQEFVDLALALSGASPATPAQG